jgi:hypothetical protein
MARFLVDEHREDIMSKKDELVAQLKDLPSGPIADTLKPRVVGLLQSCWDELSGSNYTKMEARKLDRAKTLKWNPPRLQFTIERHGGYLVGGSRAELQHWDVNLETGIASFEERGYRQLNALSPRLKVEPIVDSVIEAVQARKTLPGDALVWVTDDQVRIKQAVLIPDDASKQTMSGRRKRFRSAMQSAMATIGWDIISERLALKFKKKAAAK